MIISASRRTDIPNYYSEWFFNRLKEGYVYVRNPMNIHQISKIPLDKSIIDGIVFWTKNPQPMLERIEELDGYVYYFQFTLNAYSSDIEPNVPSKKDVVIPTFQKLSKKIGKEKVIWRYDPIILNNKYTIDYHIKYFSLLAEKLCDYTEKCTISFVDLYRNTQNNIKPLEIIIPTTQQKQQLLYEFDKIAKEKGIYIDTCAEDIDLGNLNIKSACCIDKNRFERIGSYKLSLGKDKNQRTECGCIESIDIGSYNTCKNGCLYCYANYSKKTVETNCFKHDPKSPLLYGRILQEDIIKERKISSARDLQLDLFDF